MKTFAKFNQQGQRSTTFRITARQKSEGSISSLSLIRTGHSKEEIAKAFKREFEGFNIVEIQREDNA